MTKARDLSQTPNASLGFKNRILNGDCRIDQRNAGASVTVADAYPVDRFNIPFSTDGTFTAQKSSVAPVGFTNSLLFTTGTADSSLSGSQFAVIRQAVEGFNIADFGWGTANASPVTLSFWVRSSLTGTFGGALRNSAANRSYPFNYTITVANTWEQKTITIAGDTTGTWLTNNGIGVNIYFGLGVGSTLSGTAGAWAGSNFLSATGATSVVGTSGATFYITGVQLEKGSTATSFDYRPYGTELALCQRYYQKTSYNAGNSPAISTFATGTYYLATGVYLVYPLRVSMRSAPSGSSSGNGALEIFANGGSRVSTSIVVQGQTPDQVELNVATTSSLAGAGAWARFSGSSDWIAFSAEL